MARLNEPMTDDELPPLEALLRPSFKAPKATAIKKTRNGHPSTELEEARERPINSAKAVSRKLLKQEAPKAVATKKFRRLGVAQSTQVLTTRTTFGPDVSARSKKTKPTRSASERQEKRAHGNKSKEDKDRESSGSGGSINASDSSTGPPDNSLEEIEFWSAKNPRPTWIKSPYKRSQKHDFDQCNPTRGSRRQLRDIARTLNRPQAESDIAESDTASEYIGETGSIGSISDDSSFSMDQNSSVTGDPKLNLKGPGHPHDARSIHSGSDTCNENQAIRPRTPSPPQSPTKSRLKSPSKTNRIPPTPHRPSMDEFWEQADTNDWNDLHSPQKPLLSPRKRMGMTLPNFLHVGENGNPSQPLIVDINAGGLDPPSPKKSPHKQDPQRAARRAFDLIKHRLAEQWLQELDDKICAGKIAAKTKATGGVKIVWSKNLQVTAGRARWRKDLDKNKISRGEETEERHVASIELAEKVIDDADRLRNVVAHEFCHLATYMVSGVKNNPHGKEFKYWGSQCSKAFRDQNIIVTTKHSYEISYKYIWECVECGYEYKRQSKSVDINRHSCGICKARLVQTKPVPRAASGKVSEYQLFVKENFRRLKAEHSNLTHGEVMEKMGKLYRERKKEAAVTQRSNIDALTHQLDVVVLDD